MTQSFCVEMTEDHLLFTTEVLISQHLELEFAVASFPSVSPVPEIARGEILRAAFFYEVDTSIMETIRTLLREPLRDSSFRKRFNEHFETHENPLLAQLGSRWLDEILVFEAEE